MYGNACCEFCQFFLGWRLLFVSTGPILKSVVLHDWIKCKCTSTVFEIVCFGVTSYCYATLKRWQCVCVALCRWPLYFSRWFHIFNLLAAGHLVCLHLWITINHFWYATYGVHNFVFCGPSHPCVLYLSVVHLLVFLCLCSFFLFILFSFWDRKN